MTGCQRPRPLPRQQPHRGVPRARVRQRDAPCNLAIDTVPHCAGSGLAIPSTVAPCANARATVLVLRPGRGIHGAGMHMLHASALTPGMHARSPSICNLGPKPLNCQKVPLGAHLHSLIRLDMAWVHAIAGSNWGSRGQSSSPRQNEEAHPSAASPRRLTCAALVATMRGDVRALGESQVLRVPGIAR